MRYVWHIWVVENEFSVDMQWSRSCTKSPRSRLRRLRCNRTQMIALLQPTMYSSSRFRFSRSPTERCIVLTNWLRRLSVQKEQACEPNKLEQRLVASGRGTFNLTTASQCSGILTRSTSIPISQLTNLKSLLPSQPACQFHHGGICSVEKIYSGCDSRIFVGHTVEIQRL